MSEPWRDWDHVLKLDPDKDLYEDDTFADIANCGTDALEIGGTLGITEEKMATFVDRAAEHDIPIYQEPSNPSVVVDRPGLDGYLVPVVFNAGDVFWVTGAQKEWVRLENGMDWDRTTTEAYIVMNPDASVAEYTDADCDLTAEDVAAYAEVAEQMFGQDIIYTEYSGTFGNPNKVQAAANALEESTLFYGGGIHDYDTANTMSQHADVIVVGDLVHDKGVDAVTETVNGAKDR